MKGRLFSVAIISCMALFLIMAGTSWGADEDPPVCLKTKEEIVDLDTNLMHGNWAILITNTNGGILESMVRMQYGEEQRFFRHRFESSDAFGQPTMNFLQNRLCNLLTDLSAEIAQAFGFPAGTTFVFKNRVKKGEVVPDETGDVGPNTAITDIEDLLIPGTMSPSYYGAIYIIDFYKQPPPSGGGGGGEPQTLTVTFSGTGSGSVSDGGTLTCTSICSQDYDFNSSVTLMATADIGSTFMGWSGAGCSGTGACVVTMDQAQGVTATFEANSGGSGGTGEVIRVQAEDYNLGGEGIGYHDLSAGNQCGDYRQDDVDIKFGRNGVTYICRPRDGEWLAYDVLVQGGLYNLTLRVANKDMASNAVHVEIDGVDVTGSLSLPVTGDFQNWTTITTSLNLTPGFHLLTIYMEGVDFSLDWWQLESTS